MPKKTKTYRRYPKMGGYPARRTAEKRLNAAQRPHLTPAEQLAVLDATLGVGQGAKKERARIATKLA